MLCCKYWLNLSCFQECEMIRELEHAEAARRNDGALFSRPLCLCRNSLLFLRLLRLSVFEAAWLFVVTVCLFVVYNLNAIHI